MLEKTGINAKDLKIIPIFCWNQTAELKCGDEHTNEMKILRGFEAGMHFFVPISVHSVLRIYFQASTIKHRWRNINQQYQTAQPKICRWYYSIFRYLKGLQKIMESIMDVSTLYGPGINSNKTRVMIISKQHISTEVHVRVNQVWKGRVTQF